MVAFLNHDEGYGDFCIGGCDRPLDGIEFDVEDMGELSVGDTVPVVENRFGK